MRPVAFFILIPLSAAAMAWYLNDPKASPVVLVVSYVALLLAWPKKTENVR